MNRQCFICGSQCNDKSLLLKILIFIFQRLVISPYIQLTNIAIHDFCIQQPTRLPSHTAANSRLSHFQSCNN
jgi:hypothetical protein